MACIGDSLTRGRSGGVPGSLTYPAQLTEMLGPKFDVYNYGRNAVTAIRTASLPYANTEQFQNSLDLEADIYLLMLGTNDARIWQSSAQRFPPDMRWYVKTVRNTSRENPPRVIVALPPWVKDDNNYAGVTNNIVANHVQPQIEKLALQDNDLQLVDMYDVTYNQVDSYVSDGLHLNGKGYRALAAAWKVAIQCNGNGICEVGENCGTCPTDCKSNCPSRGSKISKIRGSE